ncbi:nuclease A inhibitor family protein [Larkinella humicola]|uniref:Nuclease n=1 Tax=Larkinella humicola TaxID=2607654 RepID=A0A5N1JQZ1_9BACT|nr:nuclease A inhibitor family protein [Larkinella humicola]KAA9356732.1 nuclease [Larkinella humicola]
MPPQESTPEFSLPDFLTDLFYPSESDEPVEYVDYTIDFEPPLTVSQVKDLLLITPEIYVEEIPEDGFWKPVVTDQDWYDEDEKKRTARFIELQKTVQATLSDRQVFRVGETEVGLYLLGRKADGCWVGLKTLVVET